MILKCYYNGLGVASGQGFLKCACSTIWKVPVAPIFCLLICANHKRGGLRVTGPSLGGDRVVFCPPFSPPAHVFLTAYSIIWNRAPYEVVPPHSSKVNWAIKPCFFQTISSPSGVSIISLLPFISGGSLGQSRAGFLRSG